MWHIFSLSSVLGRPIFSVYPELDNDVTHLEHQVNAGQNDFIKKTNTTITSLSESDFEVI